MGPFKITLELYCLIPPKWVPFNDPCATKQGYDYHQSEAPSRIMCDESEHSDISDTKN